VVDVGGSCPCDGGATPRKNVEQATLQAATVVDAQLAKVLAQAANRDKEVGLLFDWGFLR